MLQKKCNRCGEVKLASEYAKNHSDKSGLQRYCRCCAKEYRKTACPVAARAARDKYAASSRGREMKRTNQRAKRYGLTREQVETLLAVPCAICGNPSEHIDHCHTTGKVRAALCGFCNKGLGQFKDNKELLLKAHNYLQEHSS